MRKYRISSLAAILFGMFSVGLVTLAGCGGGESDGGSDYAGTAASTSAGSAPAPGSAPNAEAQRTDGNNKSASASGSKGFIQLAAAVPRKIIYTANVTLVVENLTTVQPKLVQLVKTYKGYVAGTEVGGSTGSARQGRWKVRIPVDGYEGFMADVSKLGELQTIHSDSQDVTEEYYDVAARLSNKQIEERRLLRHLEQSTAKLSDILSVERELSRVRGEIEQMQGRLRVLANLSSLTTVTVTISEVKEYVAPKPTTFGAQITRSFHGSLMALRDVGKGLTLTVVALVPWLIVAALLALPVALLARRYRPRRKIATVDAPSADVNA